MPSPWLFGLLGAALCIGSYLRLESRKRSQKFFPSPPSEPILGHLRVFPQHTPWVAFADWTEKYGSIIHLSIAGRTILILNKAEDAYNLLDKRGSNYSDRVRAVLQGEIGGMEYFTGLMRYGDDFRTTRRYISQYFNSREHVYLYPLLADQVKILLKNLLDDPHNFEAHLDRISAGTVVKATYGHDIVSNDDYIKLAADAVIGVLQLGVAGLNPVDLFPSLRHVPSWLPGAGLLRRAHSARKLVDRMIDEPYESVKAQRKAGVDQSSFVDTLLEEYEQEGVVDEKRELLIKNTAGQIFGAGAETSSDALQTFILMMMKHPEVVKKTQNEIDRVIGTERLPSLEDRPNLPYIECIVKEVLRYNPPAPLGLPHGSLKDDVYKDKVIPAGTMVLSNIWAMMRDEQYFPDPHTFNPDRFLSKSSASEDDKHVHSLNRFRPDDPRSLVFGFGRRICPGRFFADSSAWLVMANVLAVFDILPPVDPVTGKEYMPKIEWMGGLSAKYEPFHARVVPRSEKHASLIQQQD